MRKIPTVFVRDEADRRHVTRDITPGCEWVFTDAGVRATRKYDGTCVMYDGHRWWARREVKPGKTAPNGFVEVDHDEVTGKTVGWEPVEQSAFFKYLVEAAGDIDEEDDGPWAPGTFELVGPKINGNPERRERHTLIRHERAEVLDSFERTFDGLRAAVIAHHEYAGAEGIVWHHPDGRMAKLKRRDFPKVGA
jgi:hypothetical protein